MSRISQKFLDDIQSIIHSRHVDDSVMNDLVDIILKDVNALRIPSWDREDQIDLTIELEKRIKAAVNLMDDTDRVEFVYRLATGKFYAKSRIRALFWAPNTIKLPVTKLVVCNRIKNNGEVRYNVEWPTVFRDPDTMTYSIHRVVDTYVMGKGAFDWNRHMW